MVVSPTLRDETMSCPHSGMRQCPARIVLRRTTLSPSAPTKKKDAQEEKSWITSKGRKEEWLVASDKDADKNEYSHGINAVVFASEKSKNAKGMMLLEMERIVFQIVTGATVNMHPAKYTFVNDPVVFGRTQEKHEKRVWTLLERCRTTGGWDQAKHCKIWDGFACHHFHVALDYQQRRRGGFRKDACHLKHAYPKDVGSFRIVNYVGKLITSLLSIIKRPQNLTQKDTQWKLSDHTKRHLTH